MPEAVKSFFNFKKIIFFSIIATVTILVYLLFGPPKFLEKSESAQFCASCHTMSEQYHSWRHSAHKVIKCVDCHLPNDNIFNHYLWKAIDGTKDLYYEFFPRQEFYQISLTNHGIAVVQNNCLKCHGEMVSKINRNLSCFTCHVRTGHKITSNIINLNSGAKDEKD